MGCNTTRPLPKLNVAIIESSATSEYDAAIVELIKRFKWKQPERLDGKPIPVLSYIRYNLYPKRQPEYSSAKGTAAHCIADVA